MKCSHGNACNSLQYKKNDYIVDLKFLIKNRIAVTFTIRCNSNSFELHDTARIKLKEDVLTEIKRSLSHKHNEKVRELIYDLLLNDKLRKFILSSLDEYVKHDGM